MSDVIVDTAPNGAIQLLKEECWKLNFLHLKDETCQATEETLIEEKSPKTKCPASVAGAADIHNTNEEASEESPNNDVVDVQDELLALVSVEKEAAGDGKVLSKVVKPKGCLKESCKDQLTPKIYDMITELPKSYFGSTESLPEMCSRGPKVCSGVPEVSNAVGEVSSDTNTTEAADDLLDTGNFLSKVVQLSTQSHPEVCNGEAELCSGPEVCSGVPGVSSGGPGGCSGVPMVCSGVPEVSNAVEEVSSDTKTEAAEDLRDTENVLSKVVRSKGWLKEGWEDQLTKDFNDMIARLPKSYFASNESLPEVCSGVSEVSNAAEVVHSDTKKQMKNGVLRFFRRVWKFFTCTNSLPKEE
ncbi:uncharacterized protein LOC120022707 [Salvelinus namaycush]|uniref:Uncharacterized protein LOC120022707 n=1 Tax=Salvelinus namaycush TaxID=8040 RepID=A0A8U0PDM6_SALNM|nr:uncharacterized protein LOC120022707 [Salvelinus namaycush]